MNLDEYMAQENVVIEDLETTLTKFNATQPDNVVEGEPVVEPTTPTPPVVEPPKPAEPVTPKPTVEEPTTPEAPDVNAANAERRRAREAKIAQTALENSPEVKFAKTIAEMSGKTVEQLMTEIQHAQIAERLKAEGYTDEQIPSLVPRVAQNEAELTRVKQEAESANLTLTQVKFEQWVARIENDGKAIIAEHPYLTQADVDQARNYMLTTLGNPDVPLKDAVYAVHGAKIFAAQREQLQTELLAEQSGRKPSALPPQGSVTAPTTILTPDEKYICKMMNISEADYIKNKTS
jgi:phage I-like protein